MNCANPECGYPLRSHRAKAADHPGTRQHAGNGICTNCYHKQRRAAGKQPNPEAITPDFDLPKTITAHNCWINDRRKRLGATA